MNKLTFLCFIVLLQVVPLRSADKDCSDKLEILAKLVALDVQDHIGDDEFELGKLMYCESQHGNNAVVNVDEFGAVGDGVSDDTQAFVDAWKQACSNPKNSVLLIPKDRRYLVNATRFKGPCADGLTIQIDGTIVAPDDPENWDPDHRRSWLVFDKLSKAVFQGKGVIDGSGSKWWAASCKRNKTNPCKGAPTALTIDSSSTIRVNDLTIQNGQQMNFEIARSKSVRVNGVKVSAPGDSPNTDGIHITKSTNIVLQNCKIGTAIELSFANLVSATDYIDPNYLKFMTVMIQGDDCISIVNGSSSIRMEKIYCGPGHGISIGSLGKNNSTGIVEKVVLDTAFIRNTTNGLRIKTWQGGSGHVKEVLYRNVKMDNVSNPIIIDQFYCDSPKTCQNQTSAVKISEIMYRNITGTSKSKVAMKFACSDVVPCTEIFLNKINLEREDGDVETYCNSASGLCIGDSCHPSAKCLSSSEENMTILQEKENGVTESSSERIIHTEL